MAVEIPDIDALKKYLDEKNLALQMEMGAGQQSKVLMPFQWK